jgi:hypothetical protein
MRIKPPFPTEVSAILHRRRQPVGSTPDSAMPRAALGVAAGARSDRLSGHNGAGRPISSGEEDGDLPASAATKKTHVDVGVLP